MRGSASDRAGPAFGFRGALLLAVAGALLSTAFAARQGMYENPFGNMGMVHFHESEELLAGRGFGRSLDGTFHPDLFTRPVYTVFLAPFAAALGRDWDALRPAIAAAQGVLLALTGLLVASVLSRAGDRRAAQLAGWGVVLHPSLVSQASTYVDTIAFTVCLVGAYACAAAVPRGAAARRWFLPGVVFGLAVLTRSTALALAPALALVLLRATGGAAARLRAAAFVAAGAALVVLPWLVRNHALTGRVMLSTVDGVNLWMGNNERTAEFLDADRSLDELPGRARYDSSELSPVAVQVERCDAAKAEAARFLRERPGDAAVLALRKAGDFWSVVPTPRSTRSGRSPLKDAVSIAWTVPLFVLAAAGTFLARRRGGAAGAFALDALVVAACFTLPHALAWGGTRLRAPFDPFLVALAAVALSSAWERLRARTASRAMPPPR